MKLNTAAANLPSTTEGGRPTRRSPRNRIESETALSAKEMKEREEAMQA